ncbi:hypothetical protein [Streptomyces sp. NPDC003717]|uniref:hypothetical protein n=1 Tax=Streptomyces sp. NPDC003717 TaxID=3154276 RepID=UPI0033BF6D37
MLTRTTVIAASAVAAAALTAVPATAAPAQQKVTSGSTKVTIAPAVAKALLTKGIVPLVTRPGQTGLGFADGRLTLTARFPVTGGRLTTAPLGGTVEHRGGLKFVNVRAGRALEVRDFVIDLDRGTLTGRVAGTATRVPVFTLDTSTASVGADRHRLDARKISLKLTDTAAGALNSTLKTTVFTAGLGVGTADTLARY